MNTVKIFYLNCDALCDKVLFDKNYRAASAERKLKIDRLRFDSDKRLALGADILIKRALGELAREQIKTNDFGKPYIENCAVRFNLSHSGSIAMIAISDTEVGCDVQKTEEAPLKVAQRYFCESEQNLINESNDKAKMFFRLWTLKESYIKMLGKGLSEPLDSFAVRFDDNLPRINNCCTVAEFELAPAYCAAVCVQGSADIKQPTEIKIRS
ncbi:MAG: 4'-phosphopantetheinyl transferase superfamily protein [Eubacterium sp.]|nr:4'-phosphopantetheinyl transferase superfamily protein [Eubacterium sp.]